MASSPSPDGKAAVPSPRRPPVDSGVSPPASADGKAAAPPAVAAPAPASTSPRRPPPAPSGVEEEKGDDVTVRVVASDVGWSPPRPRRGRASEASEYSPAVELDLDRLAESDLTEPQLPVAAPTPTPAAAVAAPTPTPATAAAPTPPPRRDPLGARRSSSSSKPAETPTPPRRRDPLGRARREEGPSSASGPPAHLGPAVQSMRAGSRGPPDYESFRARRRSPR